MKSVDTSPRVTVVKVPVGAIVGAAVGFRNCVDVGVADGATAINVGAGVAVGVNNPGVAVGIDVGVGTDRVGVGVNKAIVVGVGVLVGVAVGVGTLVGVVVGTVVAEGVAESAIWLPDEKTVKSAVADFEIPILSGDWTVSL